MIPEIDELQDTAILYWAPSKGMLSLLEILFIIFFLPAGLVLLAIYAVSGIFNERSRMNELREKHRSRTIQITRSVLITPARYVGGHPLIPQSQRVLLGLSNTTFSIYSVGEDYVVTPLATISLSDIVKVATGKPRTASEIYNEDHGHVIDVVEQSPFLSVAFRLDSRSYMASFEGFEEQTPLEWCNQIIALQYQLSHEKNASGESQE